MNYQILSIQNKEDWEKQICNYHNINFLHSYNWGAFHRSLGKKVFFQKIVADKDNSVAGIALIVCEKAKRGNYLTVAGGPLLKFENPDIDKILDSFIQNAKIIAKEENALFLRVRLQEVESAMLHEMMKKHGFRPSPMHLTADLTLQLDLNTDENLLLSQMRKTTRYEIRKADKLGITIKYSNDPNDIDKFYENQIKVAKRHNFVPFSLKFLKNQFLAFLPDDQVLLIHAYLGNTLLSTSYIIFYRNEAVYHYGISTDENIKLPGSYAAQWAAIKEAKKRGMKRYNFWGVAPLLQPNHRFFGVGLFKRGFGGAEVHYLPAYDFPFSIRYKGVRLFELARKKVRQL